MRLLGIDYGTKNIGIALSDEQGLYSFPNSVIKNNGIKNNVIAIAKICKKNNVNKIILGKSVNLKGETNPVMEEIERFKALLNKTSEIPVVYQEEILTTQEAKKIISEGKPRGKITRERKQKMFQSKKIDSSSASLILRNFIEKSNVI